MKEKDDSRSGQGTKDAKAKTESRGVKASNKKAPAKKKTETSKSTK